ncbi:helix-turn-helix transcriptional regulator [Sinorhizobium fredii]|uniref:helix-turn-helix transcriptional regulator n=1 Tax=Rhizobium fredii TaxID=380 RepID=UPI0004B6A1B1|nr:hypothetical protein [Sinorhizobium fredii]
MAGASLRELSIPRFALRRDEAAASLAISPSTFDNWVAQGLMPKGRKIGGGILLGAEEVRAAWQHLLESDDNPMDDNDNNPFDGVVA